MAGGILLTGSTGQIGGELLRLLTQSPASRGPIQAPTRAELNLADPASIRSAVRSLRPRWIVNPAAYTAVDRAESDSAQAFAINAEAPRILGEEARAIGAAVLHFSTDYVFSGSGSAPYAESDPTDPVSVYGASKLAGEQALAASGAAHLILRTSWVYGATGKNFLLTILRLAQAQAELKIVADQYGAPTSSRELARVALAMLVHGEALSAEDARSSLEAAIRPLQGVYHACAAGETTWFGFAQEALRLHRLALPSQPLAALVPISTQEFPTPAHRPRNSRLHCGKLARVFDLRLPPWQESLADVCAELLHS